MPKFKFCIIIIKHLTKTLRTNLLFNVIKKCIPTAPKTLKHTDKNKHFSEDLNVYFQQ